MAVPNSIQDKDTEKFYLQSEQVIDDAGSEYQYEAIPVEDEVADSDVDEDLDKALKMLRGVEQDQERSRTQKSSPAHQLGQKRPEVVDDFVRNFLVRMGLERTFECFQAEWYELQDRGVIKISDVRQVPDAYAQLQQLDSELQSTRKERDFYRSIALKARESLVKIRKERDFHRLNHRRIVQEKNTLISDIKRLKKHYAQYEPTLKQLRGKYEVAMKEKMLAKLERDRALSQAAASNGNGSPLPLHSGVKKAQSVKLPAESNKQLVEERLREEALKDVRNQPDAAQRHPNDSEMPIDTKVNPDLAKVKGPPGHLTRVGGYRMTKVLQAHFLPVSSVALDEDNNLLCTTSDDGSWKLWQVPTLTHKLTGAAGHKQWISSADFSPNGGQRLATSSGDNTVMIWDTADGKCLHKFCGHIQPVWFCSWHSCGDFIASASMDKTVKIWDLGSLRNRMTLRGHSESVNCARFLPYQNAVLTASADKTVQLFDARTGVCAQIFYAHVNAVTHCAANWRCDTVVSSDSFGVVNLWDIRMPDTPKHTFDFGPHSANWVQFDPSGTLLSVCSNDGTIKLVATESDAKTSVLQGHEDAVQACAFSVNDYLVSCSSDQTVRIWA